MDSVPLPAGEERNQESSGTDDEGYETAEEEDSSQSLEPKKCRKDRMIFSRRQMVESPLPPASDGYKIAGKEYSAQNLGEKPRSAGDKW